MPLLANAATVYWFLNTWCLIHFAKELRISAEAAGGQEETGKGKCELMNVTRGRYTLMSFWGKQKLGGYLDNSMWLFYNCKYMKKKKNLRNELLAWWFDLWLLQLKMQCSLWQPAAWATCATLKCSSRSLSFVFHLCEDGKMEWNSDLHCAVFISNLYSPFSLNKIICFSVCTPSSEIMDFAWGPSTLDFFVVVLNLWF